MSVVVKYVDLDNNLVELAHSGELEGKVGERIDYRTEDEIRKILAAGYVLINNPFDQILITYSSLLIILFP